MLGLGDEVGGDDLRVRALVGDDDRLGRAVDAVDADIAEDLPLRDGDEEAPRPAILSTFGMVSVP